MIEVPLTQNKFALIDDEDYDLISMHKWCTSKEGINFYAVTGKGIRMHRLIMCPEDNIEIDHNDGNGLNNQKYNLRFATRHQNSYNKTKKLNCSSIYKGVSFYNPSNKWCASIIVSYKRIHLGYFESEIDAALAYNNAAKKYFGEFAKLNF